MEPSYSEMQNNLLTAVKGGTLKRVKELFQSSNVQKDAEWFDYALLMAALQRGHKTIAAFLIQNECRVRRDDVDNSGVALLYSAVELGDIGIVRKILNKGVSYTDCDYNENSPLYLAAELQRFAIVDLMLSKYNFKEIDPAGKDDLAHFHMACLTSNLKIMKKFVERGVSVNSRSIWDIENWRGFNSLHFAVRSSDRNLQLSSSIEFLLDNSADSHATNSRGLIPLHSAFYGYTEYTALIYAALQNRDESQFINTTDVNGLGVFHICCTADVPNIVETFLKNGVDVNSSTLDSVKYPGYTGLDYAVRYNCKKVVAVLLKYKADACKADKAGKTPLHLACEFIHTEIVELLLNHSADLINAKDDKDCTPLHCAFYASAKDNFLINFLLTKIPLDTNPTDSRGLTHLHIACTRNAVNQVETLLQNGVSVNSRVASDGKSYSGYSALHFAVDFNRASIVRILLDHGADVNAIAHNSMTPLHFACLHGHTKFYELIDTIDFQVEDVDWSAYCKNRIAIVEMLLNHKSNVNASDSSGKTPLFHVCKFPIDSITRNLMEYFELTSGVFYDLRSRFKNTLPPQIFNVQKEIIHSLIGHNANLHARADSYASILHMISLNNQGTFDEIRETAKLAELLLENGADVNVVDENGRTPLHEAIEWKQIDLVKVYLKHNANINAKTIDHSTPLHVAFSSRYSIYGRTSSMAYLLERQGSDVSMLLRWGADINAEDLKGQATLSALFDRCARYKTPLSADIMRCMETIETHVKELVAAKFYVSEKVEQCLIGMRSKLGNQFFNSDQLDPYMMSCAEELEKLKGFKVDGDFSLRDFLCGDRNEIARHAQNEKLKTILTDDNVKNDFPLYSHLLVVNYKKGLARIKVMKPAKNLLQSILNFNIPDLCCARIVEYLSTKNIQYLIKADSLIDFSKRKLDDDAGKSSTLSLKRQKLE